MQSGAKEDTRRGRVLDETGDPGSGRSRGERLAGGEVPVAILGIVPTKVSAENGRVQAGDPLTTASTPGYAMKASPAVVSGIEIYPTGAILGKALQPLEGRRGIINVLVTLR